MICIRLLAFCLVLTVVSMPTVAEDNVIENVIEVDSLEQLAEYADRDGNHIRMVPGVYPLADFITDDYINAIRENLPEGGRPTVYMFPFAGNNNTFDFTGVTIEIDTTLYPRFPHGYMRCIYIAGDNNRLIGLTIRNTGPNQGSSGNILSVFGDHNTLENVRLYVHGSQPWGYGDLLGKGGPNITGLQKKSGILVSGNHNTLRRCRVISRAFGHCFYVQNANNIRLEDCYAEGVMRSTNDMLRDTEGVAVERGFKSVYGNRDGRSLITPGYKKSLVEDGFRTYGNAGQVTLINCTAINTRAGFEIGGQDDADEPTLIENGTALGCERGYLIGSNTIIRNSRGDVAYGPLLYLRGGHSSDIELELTGEGSDYTVHALATIAGRNHRVRFTAGEFDRPSPALPIMLGFGMPAHAEMASPIKPAPAEGIELINEIDRMPVIQGEQAVDVSIDTVGPVVSDATTREIIWP